MYMFEKKFQLIVDVETANIQPSTTVDPRNMLVYDIGYVIADYSGNIIKQRSFVIADVFFGEAEKMKSVYYADKIPSYIEDIIKGKRIVIPFDVVRQLMEKDIAQYNIKVFNAFNSYFDITALNNTAQYLRQDKFFFKEKLTVWDIMSMARQTIYRMKSYKTFCEKNNLLTAQGRISQKAESYYKFICNNPNFQETHKGLDDVLIETEIYKRCLKTHKKIIKELFKSDRK